MLKQDNLFRLVRAAIVGRAEAAVVECDWMGLLELAARQGVKGLVWEGVQVCKREGKVEIDSDAVLEWYWHVRHEEEEAKALGGLAAEFAGQMKPCRCVVLKGVDYARYWPDPLHREFGDLDYYSGEDFEASNSRAKEIGAVVEDGGYKHSHICYKGLKVENHRYFTDWCGTMCGMEAEKLLRQAMGNVKAIGRSALLSPSPTFTALFLLRHAQLHFIAEGISLRHVLDWLFFLRAEQYNVDWDVALQAMESMRMMPFAQAMTAFCERHFGWRPSNDSVPSMQVTDPLVDVFTADILNPQPDVYDMRLHRKALRILRRSRRMLTFRRLLHESYCTLMWHSLVYNSVTGIRPRLASAAKADYSSTPCGL